MVNEERLGKYLAIAAGVIIVLIVLLTIAICDGNKADGNKAEASNHRLWVLDMHPMYEIYVDDLTGIQYLRTSQGGVCVMVDAEGKPLIWEEEK